jgi:hypothetical protein
MDIKSILNTHLFINYLSVTHPVDALETNLAYFSKTLRDLCGGCTHSDSRFANSSSEMPRLIIIYVRHSNYITI